MTVSISQQTIINLKEAFANLQPTASINSNYIVYKKNKKDNNPITLGLTPKITTGFGYKK